MRTISVLVVVGLLLSGCSAKDEVVAPPPPPPDPVEDTHWTAHEYVDLSKVEVTDFTLEAHDGVPLSLTLFRPPTATPDDPAPVIFHTNMWSGYRWSAVDEDDWFDSLLEGTPAMFLRYGFGVVSMSQRGSGDAGGVDTIFHVETIGRDHDLVLDHLATLPWVALDAPGDPVVGGVGFSYGGVAAMEAALWQTQQTGSTRYNAIAPFSAPVDGQDLWFPSEVPLQFWMNALIGLAEARGMRIHETMHEIYRAQQVSGDIPDGSGGTPDAPAFLAERSSRALMQAGVRLDIPVLASTGFQDLLVPFRNPATLYYDGLTDEARNQSMLVMQRVAHTELVIQDAAREPCRAHWGGDVWSLMVRWYRHLFQGVDIDLGAPVQLATEDSCLQLQALPTGTRYQAPGELIVTGAGIIRAEGTSASRIKLAEGPMTLAGIPSLNATIDGDHGSRVFFALAVDGPRGPRLLGEQWEPYQHDNGGELDARNLRGIATEVSPGESVYLVATHYVDWYGRATVRSTGPVTISGIEVTLPVLEVEA